MKKRILVAPLNWGLGHATRCIPIINELLLQNIEIVIASDGRSHQLLQKEFPGLTHLPLPGYSVSYQKNGSIILQMMMQVPKILRAIDRENKLLKRIVKEYKIDAVISDNRFGLWTKDIPCVFITHQLFIKIPKQISFLEPIINFINHRYISKFAQCWIPDFEGEENLSGKLSHGKFLPRKTFFVGPLSRLKKENVVEKKHDLLVVLSGPEPQRTIFEKIILAQINDLNLKILIVRGVTEHSEKKQINPNVEMISYLGTKELNEAMNQSELLLSRSGYSTIMDLAVLGKKAIFVPTPGQPEQEYLAEKLKRKKIFYSEKQNEFDLKKALEESRDYSGLKINADAEVLRKRISSFLNSF